jgi:SAM-dependent methyltransferase
MNRDQKTSAEFFEAKYKDKSDPWDFAHSEYELQRYDATIAALSHHRYARAFEPGCSVGVLTERLAGLCDEVEAIDFSSTAVAQAARRCVHLKGVDVRCISLPDRMPIKGADLVVLSEIGYYFTPEEWRALSTIIIDDLQPGATLLAVHWLGTSDDHCMNGEDVHEILAANKRLSLEHSERHPAFRLDRWVRV